MFRDDLNFAAFPEVGDRRHRPDTLHCTRSRSEQAPGSVFHPRDESGKIDCDFLRPFWCNIKVDPER